MMIVTGRKTGWIRRWCAGVCLVGFAGLLVGCMPGGLLITPVSTQRELVEETLISEGWLARDKIAVIDVEGLLLNGTESRLFGEGEHPVSRLLEQLDKAAADSRVRAVILRINSPGGSVTASELMHQEITHFRERTGRPVFAMMMDVAASGGYHVACACDRILAHRTTVTGSIGVIMQLFNVSGTLAKIGMEAPAITSAENKAAGSPFKKMTSEQRAIFQTVVDELYADFVDVVDRGRPDLTRDEVVTLADGRVYTAPQALEAGLIDEISTMRGAVRSLKQELGVKQVRLVSYRRPLGYRPNYYARSASEPSGGSQFNLINVNAASLWLPPTPRFLYLWTPGG